MYEAGKNLRLQIKNLVNEFINNMTTNSPPENGLTTAKIFRECGLDWDTYENATSSQQQFWLVALLRELEKEGKIKRNSKKLWHTAL